jgi:hypothetical protein
VVRKDTKQLTIRSQIESKTSALPIIILMQTKLLNMMITKSYIVIIVTKMVTPWITVSVESVIKSKMTNRVMTI